MARRVLLPSPPWQQIDPFRRQARTPLSRNGLTLGWDGEDRLLQYGTVQTNQYRPDGLLRMQQDYSAVQYYVYDGDTPLLATNCSGAWDMLYEYGPDGYLGSKSPTASSFTAMSASGDTVGEYDSNGNFLANHYPLDAYGDWSGGFLGDNGYRAQARGMTIAGYTGLINDAFRKYDPTTGRFINRDPIGYDGGMNLYG